MRVVLSRSARRELVTAYAYLELRSGQRSADNFLEGVDRLLQRLAAFPELGSLRPARRHGVPDVRMLLIPDSRYTLYYRVLDRKVRVERVLPAGVDLTTLITPADP